MSLSTFLTSSSTPQRVNWETAYFHKVVWVPCVVTWTQKEFGRLASSGERNRMKIEQNMPRRAPRSRHRSAKLSARRLLTPQWRAWSIRLLQHPVRLLLLMDLASPLRFPRERGLRLSHPRRLRCRRCLASSPTMRHQSASAGCSAGRGRGRSAAPCTAGVPRQRRHREGWRVVRREQ